MTRNGMERNEFGDWVNITTDRDVRDYGNDEWVIRKAQTAQWTRRSAR